MSTNGNNGKSKLVLVSSKTPTVDPEIKPAIGDGGSGNGKPVDPLTEIVSGPGAADDFESDVTPSDDPYLEPLPLCVRHSHPKYRESTWCGRTPNDGEAVFETVDEAIYRFDEGGPGICVECVDRIKQYLPLRKTVIAGKEKQPFQAERWRSLNLSTDVMDLLKRAHAALRPEVFALLDPLYDRDHLSALLGELPSRFPIEFEGRVIGEQLIDWGQLYYAFTADMFQALPDDLPNDKRNAIGHALAFQIDTLITTAIPKLQYPLENYIVGAYLGAFRRMETAYEQQLLVNVTQYQESAGALVRDFVKEMQQVLCLVLQLENPDDTKSQKKPRGRGKFDREGFLDELWAAMCVTAADMGPIPKTADFALSIPSIRQEVENEPGISTKTKEERARGLGNTRLEACFKEGQVDVKGLGEAVRRTAYKRFYDNREVSPTVAYETAKDFLARYGKQDDDYTRYVRQWIETFEKTRQQKV